MKRIAIITKGNKFNSRQFINCLNMFSIIYTRNKKIIFDSKKDQLNFYITEYTPDYCGKLICDILIICSDSMPKITVRKNTLILFDISDLLSINKELSRCNIVTCGICEKNSVSLSSVTENSLTLNIAREIYELEMQEVVFSNTEINSVYTAIFAYTVLLLTDKEVFSEYRVQK